MKRLFLLVFGVILAVAGSAFSQDTIKIGEFGSLTGDNASFGTSQNNGVQMALEEINAAGGVLGKKIDLTVEDNETKQGETTTIVRKLISQDHVVAIIGEVASSKSLEAAPICQASKIPQIATAATNPRVTQTGDYIFRVCFTDDFQAVVIARFVLEKLKLYPRLSTEPAHDGHPAIVSLEIDKDVSPQVMVEMDLIPGLGEVGDAILRRLHPDGVGILSQEACAAGGIVVHEQDLRPSLRGLVHRSTLHSTMGC